MRAALALLLAAAVLAAPMAHARDHVQVEIVLLRHGIRSPTKPNANYVDYANASWPDWPVAPGMLTAHGHEGMRAIGSRLRQELVADGAMSKSCPTGSSLVLIGDSTPRNRESSVALREGLTPGCGTTYLAMDGATNNPLFHYRKDDDDDAAPATLGSTPPALDELQTVLLGCESATCADIARRDGKKLLLSTPDALPKAMKLAGTLSENLMLAYVEGMPLNTVAFGRGDVTRLGRIITLHNDQFAVTKKAMPAASLAASNLVAHIVAALDAANGVTTDVASLTPSHQGVVVLVGHDTNLANVAGVLGLDWHDTSRPDDYPPGGALLMALVERDGKRLIRIDTLMPSMEQLREGRFDAMRRRPVHVAGCSHPGECTVDEFAAIAKRGIDRSRVDAALPAMHAQ